MIFLLVTQTILSRGLREEVEEVEEGFGGRRVGGQLRLQAESSDLPIVMVKVESGRNRVRVTVDSTVVSIEEEVEKVGVNSYYKLIL